MITGTDMTRKEQHFGHVPEGGLDLRNASRPFIGRWAKKHGIKLDLTMGKVDLDAIIQQLYLDGKLKKEAVKEIREGDET